MKKTVFIISAIFTIWACSRQEIIPADEKESGAPAQTVCATVRVPADETKLSYSENFPGGGMGMKSVWEEGDSFLALQTDGETTVTVTFNLKSGAGTAEATFEAEASGVTADTQWKAVLGNNAVSAGSGTEIHCGYMKQKAQSDDLDDFNYVLASSTGLAPEFDFSTGTALSHVLRVKLPSGIKCIEYTPCAWNKVMAADEQIIYYNQEDGYSSNDYGPDKTSTITLSEASRSGDCIYIAIPCIDYSRTLSVYKNNQNMNLQSGVVLTVMNDDSDNATESTGYVYEQNIKADGGGIVQTLDMSGMTLVSRPRPADAVNMVKDSVVCVAHSSALKQAGDLNTFWAPFNLGASKPSEPGRYIAFGEYFDNGIYSFPAYSLRHKPNGTDNRDDIITNLRPVLNSKEGNTTFYSINASRYDAARVLWGSVWRMPYIIELSMLLNSGEKQLETIDGQQCIKFTEGGVSIYVPVAGYKKNSAALDAEYVELWSADMCQRTATNPGWNQGYAIYIKNTLDDTAISRFDRYAGLNIRPVLVKSTVL